MARAEVNRFNGCEQTPAEAQHVQLRTSTGPQRGPSQFGLVRDAHVPLHPFLTTALTKCETEPLFVYVQNWNR